MTLTNWRDIADRKRANRDALISPYVTTTEDDKSKALPNGVDVHSITGIDDVSQLVNELATGVITAEEVTRAYIKRAVVAHQATNCLTEVLFNEALERARWLDQWYEENGKTIGPLHGVPISLKDQFNVKGVDTTLGYVGRSFNPAREDAAIVKILLDLGAVIIAKTNLPQSIMWCETENPMFGLTTNPLNPKFTPGGSTGGEGALLAMHGSLIGWGTDIGGSVRIPSHINGLYGLKPTSSRLPYLGVPVSTEGQEHVPSSIGPMTRSLASMTLVTQSVIEAKPWVVDSKCVPIPWRQELYEDVQSRPLTIGVMLDDGVVKVHPPIERALNQAVELLRNAGHELINWEPIGHREGIEIMDQLYTVDGGEDIRREVAAAGEPFIPHVDALVNRGKPISVYEYWQLNKQKISVQQAYNARWNNTKALSGRVMDVILTPVMPHSAVPHRKCRWVGYTKIWNFIDYSALVLPVGKVSAAEDRLPETQYTPRNPIDAWNWSLYDSEAMDGHPIGLQIVGRRFDEEKVLGVAKVLEALMGK